MDDSPRDHESNNAPLKTVKLQTEGISAQGNTGGGGIEMQSADGPHCDRERQSDGGGITFGGGLLPEESKADAQKPWISYHTRIGSIDVGPIYVSIGSEMLGADFSFGLDLSIKEIGNPLFWRAVLMEFFVMFLFIFFTISTAVFRGNFGKDAGFDGGAPNTLMIGMSFGFMIFILVFMAAPVSGGHINPAVSIGLTVTRKITLLRCIFYVLAQMAGAVAGAKAVKSLNEDLFIENNGGMNSIADGFDKSHVYGAEIMGTGLLLTIVSAVVDPDRAASVIHIATLGPFAIGMAVFMAHLSLIPIDGCSINPARSFGPAAIMGDWTHQGVFWGGPIAGAVAATVIYEIFFTSRKGFEERWQDKNVDECKSK